MPRLRITRNTGYIAVQPVGKNTYRNFFLTEFQAWFEPELAEKLANMTPGDSCIVEINAQIVEE